MYSFIQIHVSSFKQSFGDGLYLAGQELCQLIGKYKKSFLNRDLGVICGPIG